MGLRLHEAKSVNTNNSGNVYSRSEDTSSELSGEHYSLSSLQISIASWEAEYDSWNPLFVDPSTDRWHLSRCSVLCKKIEDSIFDPPSSPSPPLLLPTMLLSLIHDTHICLKNIEPHHFEGRKKKKNKRASYSIGQYYSLPFPIAYYKMEPNKLYKRRAWDNYRRHQYLRVL